MEKQLQVWTLRWNANIGSSVLSAALTFYITPTSQRACKVASMSTFTTVYVFHVVHKIVAFAAVVLYTIMVQI